MILTKTIKMQPSGKSISYYRNKGYDAKWHEELDVFVDDLPENSNVIVDVQCDYENCKCIESIHYSKYTKNIKQNNGMFYCKNCLGERMKNVIQELYGVDNISKLDFIKEKKKNTTKKNHGVEYTLQSPTLVAKMRKTCVDRYGVADPTTLDSIKDKRKQTCIDRYDTDNVFKNEGIKKKIREKRYNNQSIPTSNQQLYLNKLYGGILNGIISRYSCDIVLEDEKLGVEYDGGGHLLSVKLGDKTKEQFDQEQIVRDNQIKRAGYKIIRIISRKDYLPSDNVLLQMLTYARTYFTENPSRTWISFDIDNSCIYNAYHKENDSDILFYDFGKLRKIKNIDVQ